MKIITQSVGCWLTVALLLNAIFGSVAFAVAKTGENDESLLPQNVESVRGYKTREERRDAGIEHEIAAGVVASVLLEYEYLRLHQQLADSSASPDFTEIEPNLQLELEIEPLAWLGAEWLTAELVFEHEFSVHKTVLDEWLVAIEIDDFELQFGELFVPFGLYFSNFLSGPSLEFGETDGKALVLDWEASERFNVSVFGYQGRAKRGCNTMENDDMEELDENSSQVGERETDEVELASRSSGNCDSSRGIDLGFAIEASPTSSTSFGLSYISDLADASERFLVDTRNRYRRKVGAVSGYFVWGVKGFELSAEYLQALDSFAELERDRDSPRAWNIELAYYPAQHIGIAWRLEQSRELEDAPHSQYGVAMSWRVNQRLSVTAEVLRGHFDGALAETDEGKPLKRVDQFGFQASFSF